jgi:hypothetical protein
MVLGNVVMVGGYGELCYNLSCRSINYLTNIVLLIILVLWYALYVM